MAVAYKMISIEYPISTECVDNAEGFPGVIVYDDETFPISSSPGHDTSMLMASADELGPYSSMRPFQKEMIMMMMMMMMMTMQWIGIFERPTVLQWRRTVQEWDKEEDEEDD